MARKPTPTRAGFREVRAPSSGQQSPDEIAATFRAIFEVDSFGEVERALVELEKWAGSDHDEAGRSVEAQASFDRFKEAMKVSIRHAEIDLASAREAGSTEWARGFVKGYNLMKLYKETREEHILGGAIRTGLDARHAAKQNRAAGVRAQEASMRSTRAEAERISREMRNADPGCSTSSVIREIRATLGNRAALSDEQLRRWVKAGEASGNIPARIASLS